MIFSPNLDIIDIHENYWSNLNERQPFLHICEGKTLKCFQLQISWLIFVFPSNSGPPECSAQYLSCSQDCAVLNRHLRCSWNLAGVIWGLQPWMLRSPLTTLLPSLSISSLALLAVLGISLAPCILSPWCCCHLWLLHIPPLSFAF